MKQVRIVLVEPGHPGNVGGSARALKTMGQKELWVVNPKRFPDPQADWRAAGALDVLDNAHVVATVDEAIADCHWVVGTSTRSRRIPWPVVDAAELAKKVSALPEQTRVAVLFGREDNGLHNDELRRCNYHLQIPAASDYSSLNLAMAVQVVCYEIYQKGLDGQKQVVWDRPMATAGDVEGLMTHLESALTSTAFIDAENPGQIMTRLRRMFARVTLDDTEVQMLRGLCRHVERLGN